MTAVVVQAKAMNEEPICYPVLNPSSLSEDAQLVYRRCRGDRLDRDVFDDATGNRYISPQEAGAFQPGDRMTAAIRELEGAGLARHAHGPYGHTLNITTVHAHYTVAAGRGSQLIRISVFDRFTENAELLAVLIGADLQSRGGNPARLDEMIVDARHETARDVEHDASTTARLIIQNPTPAQFLDNGRLRFHGVLSEAWLYPLGSDPLEQEDSDTKGTNTPCTVCPEPHPFAPYLPPEASWLDRPTFVTVEAFPLRPYLVAEQPRQLS